MISCDFFGGLGNNLFQLATTYSIHKKFGYELRIPDYTSRGDIIKYGQSNTLEFSNLFDNEFIYDNINCQKLRRYIHNDVNLSTTDYSYSPVQISDGTAYHGYFQSEKYFLGVNIQDEFKIKNSNIEVIKNKFGKLFDKKNISLHYRLGGDRVTDHMQHYHKNVSPNFYEQSINMVDDYNPDDYNILVFTDNLPLAKNLLSNFSKNLIFIDNNNDNILDFTFISLCDVNVVSNSTFSWWAAYLNKNINKKIIVTKSEWFGPGYKHFNLNDTFPKTWITL
jgi:hypothetical protein